MEKFQLAQEREEVLNIQSSRYEERLVELHSVIAELSRQCEAKVKRIRGWRGHTDFCLNLAGMLSWLA